MPPGYTRWCLEMAKVEMENVLLSLLTHAAVNSITRVAYTATTQVASNGVHTLGINMATVCAFNTLIDI